MLRELLARQTKLTVLEAVDGMAVERNRIYLSPPDTNMGILKGVLRPIGRAFGETRHLPIDYFLTSLAQDRGNKAIAVILSGSASDGTLGTKAIKAEGGITFAQEQKSAKYEGMPRSAIETGDVDFVLPPEGIARELARIGQHPYLARPLRAEPSAPTPANELDRIFILLRAAHGVDFSHYNRNTIERRIHRRMVLSNTSNLTEYVRYLRDNPREVHALYQDILINVTNFFREPEAFEALKLEVFPRLITDRPDDSPIRVWIPGCSTGEEAYSIAICLAEFLNDAKAHYPVQLFATDISDSALEVARTGSYSEASVAEVSRERLSRFFIRTQGAYQVAKPIRDMCVFAKQNIIKDPPFSRLDLISCRNVLIYLDGPSHRRVLPLFHFALRASGFLLLGRSESVSGFSHLFTQIDRKNKIYQAQLRPFEGRFDFSVSHYAPPGQERTSAPLPAPREVDLQGEINRVLLQDYTPPGFVVNSELHIVAFHGRTGPYLDPAPGVASLRLLKLTREGLPFELRTAIHQAQTEDGPVVREGVQYAANGGSREVTLEVRPVKIPSLSERYFLVLFREAAPRPAMPAVPVDEKARGAQREVTQLQQELAQTKQQLQEIIEQQESSNEELRAANEEIESSNEELQSTNEELETAKEELQATNEELTTLNDELQNRNLELSTTNNDLNNVVTNVTIPMVIVGSDLRIRRFTPGAAKALNLIAADRGRPITDLRTVLDFPGLENMVSESIESMATREREVTDADGRWHSLRVRPYRTADNKIEGAVISLLDIDDLKAEASEARMYAEAVVETVRQGILVLDEDLKVRAVNPSFLDMFQVTTEETQGRLVYELGGGEWNSPQLVELLRRILPDKGEVQDFEVTHDFPKIGRKTMLLNARQLRRTRGRPGLILLAIEDVSGRKEIDALLRRQSALIDLAQDAIIVRDLDGTVRFWNQGAERKYGWSKAEALGKKTHDLLKTKFPVALREQEEVLRREGAWAGELVHSTRDGRELITQSRQILRADAGGGPNTILEINRNITAQRETQRQLSREKTFSERLINSTVDGIAAVDRERRFTIWNEVMERLTGVPRREVVGRDLFEAFPILVETGEDKLISQALEGRTLVVEERHYKIPLTGKEGFFEVYASPIRDAPTKDSPSGEVIGCLGVIHDVTARKQAEASVRELSARVLRLQDEERRRIARELHDSTAQILTALTLNLAMVKSHGGGDGSPEAQRGLDEARSLADKAADEIRNISHLLHPPELDQVGLVAAVCWYAAKFKERTAIAVTLKSDGDIGRLPAEMEGALFRVFQESLTNIQHHSGSRTAEVRVRRQDSELVLEVADKGKGIPPELLTMSAQSAAKLGVGIAGMRERLRQLGGRLEITSSSRGTIVRAVVPWQN
jgi:PAS domain S-box-containing protein